MTEAGSSRSAPSPDVASAEAFLERLGTRIDVRFGVHADYESLLSRSDAEPRSTEALLELARSRGRLIVSGPGGSGKSAAVRRMVLAAAASGGAPLLIDLSTWDAAATGRWASVRTEARDAIGFLLSEFGAAAADSNVLDRLPADREKMLLVDGLNETPGGIAEEILDACDQIVALVPGCSVLVADRLVRRAPRDGVWSLASPLPLPRDDVANLVDVDRLTPRVVGFLDSPFFVDRAIRDELGDTALETIGLYVSRHGGLDASDMPVAARAAWLAYEEDGSRTFDVRRFADAGDADLAERLTAGGVLLRVHDETVAFSHHLIHDYLAAMYVARTPRLIDRSHRHRALDVLTMGANSFDAVSFVVELIGIEDRSELVMAIYDWNPYAAGYAISGLEPLGPGDPTADLRTIVAAMLAEKLDDRLLASRRKASDALDLLRFDPADRMRAADGLTGLIAIVDGIDGETPAFERWKRIFTISPGTDAPDDALATLADPDAVLGWTAANVSRRLELSSDQVDEVVELADHETPVVRWRACHVMGSRISERFRESLMDRLVHDPDDWVRYGAVRSLVEMASRSVDMARTVVDSLVGLVERGGIVGRELHELQRSVFLAPSCAPPGWALEGSRIFYALADGERDAAEKERWFASASRLRRSTAEPT